MAHLLIVEDDLEIGEMLKDFLESESYTVDWEKDGQAALACFAAAAFDLVLLDLMVPKVPGMAVLKEIRKSSTVPVLILSAKCSEADKMLGLSLGADDYITKPFSLSELLARIRANIRRTTVYAAPAHTEQLCAGIFRLDTAARRITRDNVPLELTAKEYEIFRILLQNPQRVYTKAQLYAQVWADAWLGDENAVNVQISRLRGKVEENPKAPKVIETVWGIGYKLGDTT